MKAYDRTSHNLVILKKPFDTIEVNQLAHALTAKWSSMRQAELRREELNRLVEQRTAELCSVISQLEKAKAEAQEAALQDSLTKLPNRRLFQNRLTVLVPGFCVKRAGRCGVGNSAIIFNPL